MITNRIKRGGSGTLPIGAQGEPLFTTDTYDLYIGKGDGTNQRFQKYLTNPVTGTGTINQVAYFDGTSSITGNSNFIYNPSTGVVTATEFNTSQVIITNNQIYRNSTSSFYINYNSDGNVIITNGVGKVSIGAGTTPSYQLHVSKDIGIVGDATTKNANIYLNKYSNLWESSIRFQTAGSTDWYVGTGQMSTTTGDLEFYSYGTTNNALRLAKATGNATFTGALSGTSATFTNTSGVTLTLQKGSGASIELQKTNTTAQTWQIAGEDPNFKIYDITASTTPFQITKSTGAATFTGALSGTSATFSSSVTAATQYTGGAITLTSVANYGLIRDANNVNRIWFENTGSYRTIFDLPATGNSFVFRDNSGTILTSISSTGAATFSAVANSSWGLITQNTGTTDANGLYVNIGSSSTGVPFRVDKGGSVLFNITNGGNVGIGTTSPNYKMQLNSSGVNSYLQFTSATTGTTSSDGFIIGTGDVGDAILLNRENTNIAFYTNNTERMRISSGGDLLVGGTSFTNSASYRSIYVEASSQSSIELYTSTGPTQRLQVYAGNSAVGLYGASNIPMSFSVNTGEKYRIIADGYSKFTNDGTFYGSTGSYHEMTATTASNDTLVLRHKATSQPFGMSILFSGTTPNNQNSYFFQALDPTNTKAYIWSDGTFVSRTGTYTNFSDVNIKQDIIDAKSQWNDIKNLRVRNYRLKDEVANDSNYPYHIGVIAQELEEISPNLVSEMPNYKLINGEKIIDGNIKIVKYSILYMKAVKALQEAMQRIEILESKLN